MPSSWAGNLEMFLLVVSWEAESNQIDWQAGSDPSASNPCAQVETAERGRAGAWALGSAGATLERGFHISTRLLSAGMQPEITRVAGGRRVAGVEEARDHRDPSQTTGVPGRNSTGPPATGTRPHRGWAWGPASEPGGPLSSEPSQ